MFASKLTVVILFVAISLPALSVTRRQDSKEFQLYSNTLDSALHTEVAFEFSPPIRPLITIQAKINGRGPYTLLVDTGYTGVLMLDDKLVSTLKIKRTGRVFPITPGNHKVRELASVNFELITKSGFKPVEGEVSNASAMAVQQFSVSHGQPAFLGVVGAEFLRRFTVVLDFSTKTMSLYPDSHPPITQEGMTSMPMREVEPSRFFVSMAQQGGRTVDALIDTGSMGTALPADSMNTEDAKGMVPAGVGNLAGTSVALQYLIPNVTFGNTFSLSNVRESNVEIVSEDGKKIGRLGIDTLSRFRVVLDFRNGFLLLQRSPDYDGMKRISGYSGIRLRGRKAPFVVDYVQPGVTATVRRGDKVTKIDGLKLDGISLQVAQSLLEGHAGQTGSVEVMGKGQTSATIIVNRSSIYDYSYRREPILVFKYEHEFVIAHVRAGNDTLSHELIPGDVVARVNGRDAKKMRLAEIESALKKGGNVIGIRRGTDSKIREFVTSQPVFPHVSFSYPFG